LERQFLRVPIVVVVQESDPVGTGSADTRVSRGGSAPVDVELKHSQTRLVQSEKRPTCLLVRAIHDDNDLNCFESL